MSKPIRLRGTGLYSKGGMEKFKKKVQKEVKGTMAKSFYSAVVESKPKLSNIIRSRLNVKRAVFAKAIRYTIHNAKPGRMPLLEMHNAIWWFSAHERGANITIRRKQYMLIPLTNIIGKRIKPQKWMDLLANLKRNKSSFVRKSKNGKLILFAVTSKENRGQLRNAVKNFRDKKGLKKVSYGTAIPIGILQKQVRMKKRIDFPNEAERVFMPIMRNKFNESLSFKKIK